MSTNGLMPTGATEEYAWLFWTNLRLPGQKSVHPLNMFTLTTMFLRNRLFVPVQIIILEAETATEPLLQP